MKYRYLYFITSLILCVSILGAQALPEQASHGKVPFLIEARDNQTHPAQARGPFEGDAKGKTRAFLRANAAAIGLRADVSDLEAVRVQHSPGGTHVRYRQTYKGIPVLNSEGVVSIGNDDLVNSWRIDYHPNISIENVKPELSAAEAITTAHGAVAVSYTHLQVRGLFILMV